MAIIAVINTGE